MLKPDKMNLKHGWNVLLEARKGNVLSQHIYNSFAAVNAMPTLDEAECRELTTYEKFVTYHNKMWYCD